MDVSSSILSGNPGCLVLGVETNTPSVGNWTQELVSGGEASEQGGGVLAWVRCACSQGCQCLTCGALPRAEIPV